MRWLLLTVGLLGAACPGGESRLYTASWALGSAIVGRRTVDDAGGGRVTCTVDVDRESVIDERPLLTFAAIAAADGRRQPGVYYTVRGFRGPGLYRLGFDPEDHTRGSAVVFDEAVLSDCASPDDTQCYGATERCSLTLETWSLGEPVPPGVRSGVATGRFECAQMENAALRRAVTLSGGAFTCRATDWTGAR
jgi:hypothetical protein